MNDGLREFVAEWRRTVDPAPTALIVAHAPPGGAASVLLTEATSSAKKRTSAAADAELAERFEAAALSHATATGGSQRYSVAAMNGASVLAQHFFRLETTRHGQGVGDAEGEGSAKDLVKQSLRHSEKLHRMQVQTHEATLGIQTRMLESISQRFLDMQERFHAQFLEQVKLTQELLDHKHTRDLEAAQAARKDARLESLFDRVSGAIPMILASLSGSSPAAKLLQSFSLEHFRAFAETLNDEQRQLLDETLTLAQQGDEGAARLLGMTAVPAKAIAAPNGAAETEPKGAN